LSQKIGIFGNFGGSNIGNEGSLEAMMTFLQQHRPDAQLVCICSEPDTIERNYQITAHHMRVPRIKNASLFRKLRSRISDIVLVLKTVRKLDALIVPGTGVLDDFGEPPQGLPLTLFTVCLVAKLRGIKVGFVSVGAGPINHPVSRWLMKSAAALTSYCSFRDHISKDYMQGIGLNTSDMPVYPDLAFKLPEPPEQRSSEGNRLSVGVGVMAYFGWASDPESGADIYNTYLHKITDFTRWLLMQGYSVRVLTGEASDQRAVKDLLTAIAKEKEELNGHQITAEPTYSLHDLMSQISATDVVVATRFHNVLCSVKMARPTISLGYAKKNDVLLAEMGLDEFCQYVENFDPDLLIAQFNKLVDGRKSFADRLAQTNIAYQQKLNQQDQVLLEKLL
jgi:polysaccharide pyruvyl transferase WcaK-like protein